MNEKNNNKRNHNKRILCKIGPVKFNQRWYRFGNTYYEPSDCRIFCFKISCYLMNTNKTITFKYRYTLDLIYRSRFQYHHNSRTHIFLVRNPTTKHWFLSNRIQGVVWLNATDLLEQYEHRAQFVQPKQRDLCFRSLFRFWACARNWLQLVRSFSQSHLSI